MFPYCFENLRPRIDTQYSSQWGKVSPPSSQPDCCLPYKRRSLHSFQHASSWILPRVRLNQAIDRSKLISWSTTLLNVSQALVSELLLWLSAHHGKCLEAFLGRRPPLPSFSAGRPSASPLLMEKPGTPGTRARRGAVPTRNYRPPRGTLAVRAAEPTPTPGWTRGSARLWRAGEGTPGLGDARAAVGRKGFWGCAQLGKAENVLGTWEAMKAKLWTAEGWSEPKSCTRPVKTQTSGKNNNSLCGRCRRGALSRRFAKEGASRDFPVRG